MFFLSLSFGIFVYNTSKIFPFSRFRKIAGVFVNIFVFTFFVYLFSWMLFLSGDKETNPGKKSNLNKRSTIYHWNLNSLSAHSFAKVHLGKANASLEHTWTLVSLFIVKSCTYPAMSLPGVIVQLKVNVELYLYIVKTIYH